MEEQKMPYALYDEDEENWYGNFETVEEAVQTAMCLKDRRYYLTKNPDFGYAEVVIDTDEFAALVEEARSINANRRMKMEKNKKILSSATKWVERFNAIPTSLLEKLDCEEVREITPLTKKDKVRIFTGEDCTKEYQIVEFLANGNAVVEDEDGEILVTEEKNLERAAEQYWLPAWGVMWSFGDNIDEDWLNEKENQRKMAECGFRIYEQEDLGYVFGIDGGGYDFYAEHWVPLYIARGLKWHEQ